MGLFNPGSQEEPQVSAETPVASEAVEQPQPQESQPEAASVEEVQPQPEPEQETPVADRSAYNCPACKGEGLLDQKTLCSTCLGTGKV